jgi:hypothetical protein
VLALAEHSGLHGLVGEHVRIERPGGANAPVKVASLVAGMLAGADSIDDMDLLRHGAMVRLFARARAPSTLGTFLRAFTFGHVRQMDAVASRLMISLAARAPLLSGTARLAYVDVDDTVRQTYGYAKQGAGRGYTGVTGPQRTAGGRVHSRFCAGDRGRPAAQRLDEFDERSGSAGHRRADHRADDHGCSS